MDDAFVARPQWQSDEVHKEDTLSLRGPTMELDPQVGRQSDFSHIKAKRVVFPNAEEMKARLKADICKPEFNVHSFYHERGVCQNVARSSLFENCTLMVVTFNALWIAVDTDLNTSPTLIEAPAIFQIGEQFFCFYFAVEWLVRFGAFALKRNIIRDHGFLFDSVLVILMVLETWVVPTVQYISGSSSGKVLGGAGIVRLSRLLRLTRMARMARLLRAVPELLIIAKSVVAATRSVFFTLCFLVIICYVHAIAFTQMLSEEADKPSFEHFPNVPESMFNLISLSIVLDDFKMIVVQLMVDRLWGCAALFGVFILLAGITVMNMLVGVLVEVVSVLAATEKEALVIRFVKAKLQHIMQESGFHTDDDRGISKHEFAKILDDREATKALQDVGVDVVGLVDFTDFIFNTEDEELNFSDFMELVLQLRGSNNATVKDVVDLRKFVRNQTEKLEDLLFPATQAERTLPRSPKLSPMASDGCSIVGPDTSGTSLICGVQSCDDSCIVDALGPPLLGQRKTDLKEQQKSESSSSEDQDTIKSVQKNIDVLNDKVDRVERLVTEILCRITPETHPKELRTPGRSSRSAATAPVRASPTEWLAMAELKRLDSIEQERPWPTRTDTGLPRKGHVADLGGGGDAGAGHGVAIANGGNGAVHGSSSVGAPKCSDGSHVQVPVAAAAVVAASVNPPQQLPRVELMPGVNPVPPLRNTFNAVTALNASLPELPVRAPEVFTVEDRGCEEEFFCCRI
eukprot:TRINITY_DN49605_c0_g1_i1.p1 TRINITY_DN49605_c0_g1~~TRINITY_DN49605_c0_g1_i1.p1  ORF type:complete len:743 (-),score=132.56 TRINITY_DN49605_c0_g1_i1:92-2320(-)